MKAYLRFIAVNYVPSVSNEEVTVVSVAGGGADNNAHILPVSKLENEKMYRRQHRHLSLLTCRTFGIVQ